MAMVAAAAIVGNGAWRHHGHTGERVGMGVDRENIIASLGGDTRLGDKPSIIWEYISELARARGGRQAAVRQGVMGGSWREIRQREYDAKVNRSQPGSGGQRGRKRRHIDTGWRVRDEEDLEYKHISGGGGHIEADSQIVK